jgi:alkanesulfonate monooxygenase SsuD/methylene tetrahydromethanopterin reductase-like flavin-dependent oxidoreductase (luciferase family)
MRIGIGLPSTIPGTPGLLLVDWARRAEERGFTSLATLDRIAYPSYESLTALAAAAAVTDRSCWRRRRRASTRSPGAG